MTVLITEVFTSFPTKLTVWSKKNIWQTLWPFLETCGNFLFISFSIEFKDLLSVFSLKLLKKFFIGLDLGQASVGA